MKAAATKKDEQKAGVRYQCHVDTDVGGLLTVEEIERIERLKWAAHEAECESAAMALIKERERLRRASPARARHHRQPAHRYQGG